MQDLARQIKDVEVFGQKQKLLQREKETLLKIKGLQEETIQLHGAVQKSDQDRPRPPQ